VKRGEMTFGDGITIAAVEQRVTLLRHGGRGLGAMHGADDDDIRMAAPATLATPAAAGRTSSYLATAKPTRTRSFDFDGVGAAAGDIIRLRGFAPGTRVVETPYDTWSSHGVHVWPHGSGYELGDFTAPKGLVMGQDIVFG
jgi:hypothetical protein